MDAYFQYFAGGYDRRSGKERRRFDDNIMPPDKRSGVERRTNWIVVNNTGSDDSKLNQGESSTRPD